MSRGLTVRGLDAIKPGEDRREIPDAYLRGLYFIVQPTGARTWAVRYRFGGRSRKYTIGPYPAVDLAAARKLGAAALRTVAEGRDPFEAKRQLIASHGDSVAAVVAQFVERHCKRKYRPRPLREAQRYLNNYIVARWGSRPINQITRRDVRDMLESIVEDSPVAANRLHGITRKFFGWAVEHDILPASPVNGLRPLAVEHARERILDDRELAAVWRGAEKMGGPFGCVVQLLILTGARKSEVAGMRWDEVGLGAALWTLPGNRTKNGRLLELPLSHQAVSIIKVSPRITGSPFVFSASGVGPINNWSFSKGLIDEASGVSGWVFHDLRRTCASGMAKLGVSLPVIEKVLNHVSGSFAGIVSVYQRHDYASEKRAALQRWADHVTGLVRS
jgi:integrase